MPDDQSQSARINGPEPAVLLAHVTEIRRLDTVKRDAESARQDRFKAMRDDGINDRVVRRIIKEAGQTAETKQRLRDDEETLERYKLILADTPLEQAIKAEGGGTDDA